MNDLKEKTKKGLFWGALNTFSMQAIGLVFGIFLGRLLSPDDYGMVAMISVFLLLGNSLQDSGFKAALTNIKNPTHDDYNAVFWFNIIVGLSLYGLMFLIAPLIGQYYHNPAIVPLVRYASLTIVAASIGTAQFAWLFKNLRAKQQAKAAMTAVTISGLIGITMAYCGMTYWSLATQGLSYSLIYSLMQWRYSPWRPSFRNITFRPIRRMFRFSCKILATNITTQINNNVLNILLGRYFTAHDTGNYNQAYQWNFKCYSLIQNMLSQVAQPVFADLRDQQERQLHALRKMTRFAAFISFPLLLGFGLVAKEFIILTITERWIVSAEFIQILCIAGAFIPMSNLFSNLIISHGKSGTYFWCTFSLGALQIVLMSLIWPLGIRTMVIAYTAINIVWLFVWFYFASRLCAYRLRQFLGDIMPYAMAAVAVMAATYFITAGITPLWLKLIARIICAATIYFIVMKLAHSEILEECLQYAKKKKK